MLYSCVYYPLKQLYLIKNIILCAFCGSVLPLELNIHLDML